MTPKKILGNTSLTQFDAIIIGSGASASPVAEILTRFGQKVLILEAGANYYKNLDDPKGTGIDSHFSNDSLKFLDRHFITPDPVAEPQTFRADETLERSFVGDVQFLAKTVGGALTHAGMKFVRFDPNGFRTASMMGKHKPRGTNFADWPVTYDQLEPFYHFIEHQVGVQGLANSDPFAGPRSGHYPMPPGVDMYSSLLLANAAKGENYHPFPVPAAINSRPFQGRPACIDCGFCSDHGCPNGSKGLPAYTLLRQALLSGRAQLRSETRVTRLVTNSQMNQIRGVEVLTPEGVRQTLTANRYILAASPIEDARLLLMSDPRGPGIGNHNGLVGRNLMFHLESFVIGIFAQRLHNSRGRDFTHAMSDFVGIPGDPRKPLGGLVCFDTGGSVTQEAMIYAKEMEWTGSLLKKAMQQSPMRERFTNTKMIGQDAPQLSNRVDLDPRIRDINGLPVSRITYANHDFELSARQHYARKLEKIVEKAGAKYSFLAPMDNLPVKSRHIAGTLRFGNDPSTSVCDATGRFHSIENLWAVDGSLFPTFPGFNPSLTIMALASYLGALMVAPHDPMKVISAK